MKLNLFASLNIDSVNVQEQLISLLTENFQSIPPAQKLVHFQEIFTQLFETVGCDLKNFCRRYHLTRKEKATFFSDLAYGIYYYEIPFFSLYQKKDPRFVEHFLLILLAEKLTKEKLHTCINSLSWTEQLQLMYDCLSHVREGSYILLDVLEAKYKNEKESVLITNLRRNYFDVTSFKRLIDQEDPERLSIDPLIQSLEDFAEQQVREVSQLIPILLERIIDFPTRGHPDLTTVIKAIASSLGMPTHAWSECSVESSQHLLKQLFSQYLDQSYSIQEMKEFFRIFGLSGYVFECPITNNQHASLLEIFQILSQLLLMPFVMLVNIKEFILFVLQLCQQLFVYHRDPSCYIDGINRMVYALPTKGKNLSALPWIPSILSSLHGLGRYLNEKEYSSSLVQRPILIFDQSNGRQFQLNRTYIEHQSQEFGIPIWHLSKRQILTLAKKIGVSRWIRCFGYGGSRNCVYLLAPVIIQAYEQGKTNIDQILNIDAKDLHHLYEEAVLGKHHADVIIHMGEDDVAVPACCSFVDAYSSYKYKDFYFERPVYCYGRKTYVVHPFLGLENLLKDPSSFFSSTFWESRPFYGGLKAALTKPRFCLPLPFGNEERQVKPSWYFFEHFNQPIIHLAGTRFPHKIFPVSPLDGMIEHLKAFLPYAFQICMLSDLTDPDDLKKRCIFPWNDLSFREAHQVHSLQELWDYVTDHKTIKELHRRFWDNLKAFVLDLDKRTEILSTAIMQLKELSLTTEVPIELADYYKSMQQEAILFIELSKTIVQKKSEGLKNPLTVAKREVEKQLGVKVKQSILAKDFFSIVKCIVSFPNSSI